MYATPGPGAYQDAEVGGYVKPFEEATGAKVVLTVQNDAKLITMVKAGNVSIDVTDSDPFFDLSHCNDVLEPLDDITGINGTFPEGSVSQCSRPSLYSAMLVMYNSKTFPANPPTTIADFFDTQKFPGNRVMPNQPYGGFLEYALLADGVAIDDLYPLDIDRALKVFDKIKADSKITPTGSQEQQLMLNNQADLAIVPSTRAFSVFKAGGTDWKIMKTPIALGGNSWAIPKGAKNLAASKAFIKFASQPEQQKRFAEWVGGLSPANESAKPTYSGLSREVNPMSFSTQFRLDPGYWSKNYDKVVSAFSEWAST